MNKCVATIAMATLLFTNGFALSQEQKHCEQPSTASDIKFKPGQVWTFKGRSFEPGATLTVLRVESLSKVGEVIHVRLDGIRLRNCSGGAEPDTIEHAPFTRDAIERSALKLIRTSEVPSYEEGYSDWLKHCGGVYTITASEMVIVDEKTFNSQSNCSFN